jgi:phosphoenolpyruvate carboxylase
MDTKKLAQLVKLVVEKEIKRQLPKLVSEEVKKSLSLLNETTTKKVDSNEYDAFEMANKVLNEERENNVEEVKVPSFIENRRLSNNPVLNEVLQQTQPFSSAQHQEAPSVLDNFKQPIEESVDKTLSFDSNMAQGGVDVMRAQMAQKMGYGDMNRGASKQGLGVSTGLPGLDRILNRDNSELVKRFKK